MARCVRTVPPARAVGPGALELFFVSGSVLGPDPVGIDVQLQDGFWGEGGVGVVATWRCTPLPGGRPLSAGLEDGANDAVLGGRGEGGDDLHLAAAALADFRIIQPYLADELSPGAAPGEGEFVFLLGLGFGAGERGGRPRDPPPALAERGGDGAVEPGLRLVAQLDMGDDEGEEFEAGDELVVPSESRMVAALVVNHTGVEEGDALQGDGGALEVLEERLELLVVAGGDASLGVDVESRVGPGADERNTLFIDDVFLLEEVENGIAERELEG